MTVWIVVTVAIWLAVGAWAFWPRTIGTRSLLFGVHQFLLHPLVVAWAWVKLYGFRRQFIGTDVTPVLNGYEIVAYTRRDRYASILNPLLWLAFFLHDVGYWGKPNMDGPEGERHPEVGAGIIFRLTGSMAWHDFVMYHSRFLAKRDGRKPSTLCIADKLAIVLPPWWVYLPLARLSGEVYEYMARSDRNNATGSKYAGMHEAVPGATQREWHRDMTAYVRGWVAEHRDGREDTWTPQPGPEGA